MKYKLKDKFSQDPDKALQEILKQRGVKDIKNFCFPTRQECELDPYELENIEAAADMLLRHLHKNSKILFIVD